MNKYIAEFIGTFFLVLTIGCVVLAPPLGMVAPLAIASALIVMVYALGHISGAHFNPAVTIAVLLRGRCKPADVGPYIGAQLLGAALAAFVVGNLRPAPEAALVPAVVPALVSEFLFTFALAFVVLSVATAKATQGNSYYGLAIGFTVLAGAWAVGDISGGAFNPAVAVGASMMGLISWNAIWIYLVANIAGAVGAAMAFRALHPDDK